MVFTQCQHFGGYNSAMYRNNNGKTAYSWRNATIGINLDIFYSNPDARARPELSGPVYVSGHRPRRHLLEPGLALVLGVSRRTRLEPGLAGLPVPDVVSAPATKQETYDPDSIFCRTRFAWAVPSRFRKPLVARIPKQSGVLVDKVNAAILRVAAAAGQKLSEL